MQPIAVQGGSRSDHKTGISPRLDCEFARLGAVLLVLRLAALVLAEGDSSSHAFAGAFLSTSPSQIPTLNVGRVSASRPISAETHVSSCKCCPNVTTAALLMSMVLAACRHGRIRVHHGTRYPKSPPRRVACAALVKTKEANLQQSKCPTALDEVDALRQQAALLRASAEELQMEQSKQQRLQQLERFKSLDVDCSGYVDVHELQCGWKQVSGVEITHSLASRLLEAHDKNGNGVIEFEEFDTKEFQATLEKLWAQDEEAQLVARQQEQERNAKLEAERQLKEYYETLPGRDDTGFGTRLFSAVAYLLPLMDVAKYGLVIGFIFPGIMPSLDNLVIVEKTLGFLGTILIFFGMQVIASRNDLPASLRFNLYQALNLDVILIIPSLLNHFTDGWVWIVSTTLAFLLVATCIMYCMVCIFFQGRPPRSIPFISEWAERNMGLEPPSIQASTNNKDESP